MPPIYFCFIFLSFLMGYKTHTFYTLYVKHIHSNSYLPVFTTIDNLKIVFLNISTQESKQKMHNNQIIPDTILNHSMLSVWHQQSCAYINKQEEIHW